MSFRCATPLNCTRASATQTRFNRKMTALSNASLIRMNKPKLRFSIDALMGKDAEEVSISPEYRENSSPVSVKDYSIPKFQAEGAEARSRLHPQRSPQPPVLVPIPTFPAGAAASSTLMGGRDRSGFFGPASAAFCQRTLPHCPPGMESAFSGMFFPSDALQSYPWYLQRQRLLHHRFTGPDLPGYLLPPFRKAKRIRTAFSASQLMKLESAFDKNHYVTGNERKQLAENLGLTETQVKVWFQNRRTKEKRQVIEDRERSDKGSSLHVNKSIDNQHRHSSTSDPNLSPSGQSESVSLCDDDGSDTSYGSDHVNKEQNVP